MGKLHTSRDGAATCHDGDGVVRRAASGVRTAWIAVTALALALAGCTGGGATAPAPSSATAAGGGAAPAGTAIPDVVARLEPSVVTIFAGKGLGSGVVYKPDGAIITNAHVVGTANRVEVAFADGTRISGQVRATDELTDLAVVMVQRSGLPAVTMQTTLPRPGEIALAMGSPLGFENTVTQGVVSGVGRQIAGSAAGGYPLVDLLQTDAAISPGNSGGALINARGEVIGINDAYIPPQAGAVSLGFAIPAATAVDISDQLLANGKAVHPYLGVSITTLTPQIAQSLGVKVTSGALVREVTTGAPATEAGLRPGDVIVSFNNAKVASVEDVYAALRRVKPGDRVDVGINRSGNNQTLSVTLGTLSR